MGIRACQRCETEFSTATPNEVLCPDCRKVQPTCDNCLCIMAPQYGYRERYGIKIGKFTICGGCRTELAVRGYLRPVTGVILYPDGRVTKQKRKVAHQDV